MTGSGLDQRANPATHLPPNVDGTAACKLSKINDSKISEPCGIDIDVYIYDYSEYRDR